MNLTFKGSGGYPYEVECAKSHLTVGKSYKVLHVIVHAWKTEVALLGLCEFDPNGPNGPSKQLWFNHCMFEDCQELEDLISKTKVIGVIQDV